MLDWTSVEAVEGADGPADEICDAARTICVGSCESFDAVDLGTLRRRGIPSSSSWLWEGASGAGSSDSSRRGGRVATAVEVGCSSWLWGGIWFSSSPSTSCSGPGSCLLQLFVQFVVDVWEGIHTPKSHLESSQKICVSVLLAVLIPAAFHDSSLGSQKSRACSD